MGQKARQERASEKSLGRGCASGRCRKNGNGPPHRVCRGGPRSGRREFTGARPLPAGSLAGDPQPAAALRGPTVPGSGTRLARTPQVRVARARPGPSAASCSPDSAPGGFACRPPILTNASWSWDRASRIGLDLIWSGRLEQRQQGAYGFDGQSTWAGSRSASVPGTRPVRRIPRLISVTTFSRTTCSTRICLICSSYSARSSSSLGCAGFSPVVDSYPRCACRAAP